ncbi:MAG: TIGR02452 family protein [Gammaproteobacteria bacterium HGW-Gammaproteobacteria-8]|nr:MAG: TIGR02452 family protein [Gammaproteobacteria bacterium HGW-Gammaproteobacteria-8]
MKLKFLPAEDSPAHAESAKRRLWLERRYAIWLGETAAQLCRTRGIHDGAALDLAEAIGPTIGPAIDRAVELKQSIGPDQPLPVADEALFASTRVRVVNDTTLAVTRRLSARDETTAALNLANGIEPGGGFLVGSLAQEESLCRSSALYATLEGDPMYQAHRRQDNPHESSAWIIRSPQVPVFRNDDGSGLEAPWCANFLTCAAPFAPMVGQPRSHELLDQRIGRLLALASAFGHRSLVLGAWGCGAFQNDPAVVARLFQTHLERYAGLFSEVVFAITDWSEERRTFGPFARTLAARD